MALDMNTYRDAHINRIRAFIKNKKKPGLQLLSDICIMTGVHIVVCCHLIAEVEGKYTEEMEKAIAGHVKFYNVPDAINSKREEYASRKI